MAKKINKKEESKKGLVKNTLDKNDLVDNKTVDNNPDINKETMTDANIKEVQNPPETAKKQSRQLIWAVVLMILIILIILLTPYVMKNYFNKFTYIDLDFYKTKMGEITFYSTNIPLTDRDRNIISEYPLNLRNDPRKLDEIPYIVNATDSILNDENNDTSKIVFKKFQTVYLSLQSDAPRCEDNMIAVVGFTKFLKEFADMNVKAATDNKDYANETGYPYVICRNYPTNTVIHLVSGNNTQITKISDNCYELEYSNCEITQITERFIIEILKGYMNEFMKYFNKYGPLGLKG